MPPVSRFMIKLAFAWLLVGLVLTAAQAAFPAPAGWWPGAGARIAAFHVLTVGWLTQLIFGVAYWLFPRISKENPYGPAAAGYAALVLLNAGIVLRTIGGGRGWSEVAGGITELAGVAAITAIIWPRIRTK